MVDQRSFVFCFYALFFKIIAVALTVLHVGLHGFALWSLDEEWVVAVVAVEVESVVVVVVEAAVVVEAVVVVDL